MIELLKRKIARKLKGTVRRQTDRFLPTNETREYKHWITQRLAVRQSFYQGPLEPGLLSILTAVWDGSPVHYLSQLAKGIEAQNTHGACEWVILDNGCSKPALVRYLAELGERKWIRIIRTEQNVGIIRALRLCLESATARYFCSVDADDWLYPDALKAVTWALRTAGYPPLLFTDEDKVIGNRHYQPYLKPGWDPVLLLNSAYIAHLGVTDRAKALTLGAYNDMHTEASPDWDLFVRFLMAGLPAAHLPEIVYSWQVHAESTADDAASKSSVSRSQQAVLQRFLDCSPRGQGIRIRNSPLLPGAPHWHFVPAKAGNKQFQTMLLCQNGFDTSSSSSGSVRISINERPDRILTLVTRAADTDEFIAFIGEDVDIETPDWPDDVLTIAALHPDVVMIGGRIRNRKEVIMSAGQYFGVCGVCGCPYRGLPASDPGYFAQMWKQRSVSAVTTQFAAVKARFLLNAAGEIPAMASLSFCGAWLGAIAHRRGKRIVYSPFVSGISDLDWEELTSPAEQELFARENRDLIPDHRFYSPALSASRGFALGETTYEPCVQHPLSQ